MKVADVAGQDSMRGLWSVMYHRADGIIYVIDGKDIGRLPLAISELKKVMDYPALEDKPFLILVNKHDIGAFDASACQERSAQRTVEGIQCLCENWRRHTGSDDMVSCELDLRVLMIFLSVQ